MDIDIDYLTKYASETLDSQGIDLEFLKNHDIFSNEDPYNRLVDGLASLYNTCAELTELFNQASTHPKQSMPLKKMILGYLFETKNKISHTVSSPIKDLYDATNRDTTYIMSKAKPMNKAFEIHHKALKIIRDSIYHRSIWYDNVAANRITEQIFNKKIPGILHEQLFIYGLNTNSVLRDDNIGIRGVGCFGLLSHKKPFNKTVKLNFFHPHLPSHIKQIQSN